MSIQLGRFAEKTELTKVPDPIVVLSVGQIVESTEGLNSQQKKTKTINTIMQYFSNSNDCIYDATDVHRRSYNIKFTINEDLNIYKDTDDLRTGTNYYFIYALDLGNFNTNEGLNKQYLRNTLLMISATIPGEIFSLKRSKESSNGNKANPQAANTGVIKQPTTA